MLTKALLVSVLVFASSAALAETMEGGAIATCDRLAGDRRDPDVPAGTVKVDIFDIDASRAVPACRAALSALATSSGHDVPTAATLQILSWFGRDMTVVERRLQFQLGRALYASGALDEAKSFFGKAAAAGSGTAMIMQCLTDAMPRNGTQDEKPDEAATRRCYETGAAAGHPEAMRLLGVLQETAEGPARDLAAARRWYEKAASAGSSAAMLTLAKLHAEGEGVPRDAAVARTWLEKAAAAGETEAMEKLGALYEDGKDVPADLALARRWYEKAAASGSTLAMTTLALMSTYGTDGPQDYGAVRAWYEKAALAGDGYAMNQLGILYEAGAGVSRDPAAARAWFEKAAADGSEEAASTLAALADAGSPLGGVVLTRKAGAGDAYGAPGARTCSSQSLAPAGPGGTGRAVAYAICGMEYDNGSELTLLTNVRLTVGAARPYDSAKDETHHDIVKTTLVYDISGSLTRYTCEKRDGKTNAPNCRRSEWRNVTGRCLFHASNRWDCPIKYDMTAEFVSRNNAEPPSAED